MDWYKFLHFIETEAQTPILHSLLKNTTLLEEKDDTITLNCSNLGVKIYLDNKREEFEELISQFLKRKVTVLSVVKEKPQKKTKDPSSGRPELPLIAYQDSFEQRLQASSIQKRFSFENFAVSNTNQIAYAAARSVAEHPGTQYNPLFVYGGVGVGKTHILQAIGQEILAHDPSKKVLYCTSEEFTNDLIDLIRKKTTSSFRSIYRNVDVLLVDDAQFIAGKNYVQEEFYHTFNTLVKNGGQIVLCSDRHPREIKELEDRLRSRFSGGLIIDIQNPDFELRTAILLIKAKERNIPIDIEAAKKMAEKMTDARELEGILLQMYSKTLLVNNASSGITLDVVDSESKRQEQEMVTKTTPADVIKAVCLYYDVKPSDVKGQTRKSSIALTRQIIMYILRVTMKYTLEEVAFFLKRKDHTTIMHGVEKIQTMIMKDESFKRELDRIIDTM